MTQSLIRRGFLLLICCAVVLARARAEAAEATATTSIVPDPWGVIAFPVSGPNVLVICGGGQGEGTEACVSLSGDHDQVVWKCEPTRWGMYDVEILYSAEKQPGLLNRIRRKVGTVLVEVAGKQFSTNYYSTGNSNTFTNLVVGRFYMEKAEPFRMWVQTVDDGKVPASRLNLRSIRFIPAPEGKSIIQRGAGPITLHASNAITHSVTMRYEPNEKKNCLGYWVNPKDWAEWKFTVTQPGTYDVELWQGCGKGQGGSDVDVVVDGERFSFIVDDTGHFQNFVPRQIGKVKFSKAGIHSIEVRPRNKHADAIMDIRQILLKRVKAP
jgi:hypothetical protein